MDNKYTNLVEDDTNKKDLDRFFDNSNFFDAQQFKDIKRDYSMLVVNSNNYKSINDCKDCDECIDNNYSSLNNKNISNKNMDNKHVKFSNELSTHTNDKQNHLSKNSIIDNVVDFLYIFFVLLFLVSSILNRKSINLIISLFITLVYIFYKIWIEQLINSYEF